MDYQYQYSSIYPIGLDLYLKRSPTLDLFPQPQIPVTEKLEKKFYIDSRTPNPFTIKPIDTQWHTNELLMKDPELRVAAWTGPLDIGLKQASNFVSPQHLLLPWAWCGGYQSCGYR
jgi:hypothetical protein